MDHSQFEVHAQVEEKHWWFLARHKILRTLLHATIPSSKDTLIIDVGCGTGGNTSFLSKEYTCIGIDPVAEGIALAKMRFPHATFRVGYAPQDVPEMTQADAVLLMDVLEHIEDDFLFVSTLLSAMKPGAVLIMMAPAGPELWSQHDAGFDHYRRYMLKRFQKIWEGLPAKELLVSYCNTRLYPLVLTTRTVTRILHRTLGPAQTDLGVPPSLVNKLLLSIFSGERKRLLGILQGKRRPYRKGVSVLAVLQRTEGVITPRTKPDHLIDQTPWRMTQADQ